MDITETFESHHISTRPEELLGKFLVRKVKTPRNSPFTFEENGFYRTLKRNVRNALKEVPTHHVTVTKAVMDCLMIITLMLAISACSQWNFLLGLIAGLSGGVAAVAGHNYYHQRDNFRMYYNEMLLVNSREMRIVHVLSHHGFPNTIADLQSYIYEPMVSVFPQTKSTFIKCRSLFAPILFWPLIFHAFLIARIIRFKQLRKTDFLSAVFPLAMYLISGQLLSTFLMWAYIIAVQGFCFSAIAFATTHYHPNIFVDGDKPRPPQQMDWGIFQLDTATDKYEVDGNLVSSYLSFGDHAVHHLFPSLDHGLLHHLYPVVEDTMEKFDLNIRMKRLPEILLGYFQVLTREEPNKDVPNLLK